VITGSFTFTSEAEEKNAENLVIINSRRLAGSYLENWNLHKSHSEEFKQGELRKGESRKREKKKKNP
jgi:phosphatidylserine/phosphatidylglycerophosphate/cardiolipin synthase-like enzyme